MSIWLHAWKEPGKWFHQSSTQKHLFTWEPRPACGCSGMAACWDWARLGVGLGCTRASELWANATLLLNTILEMLNIHTEERKCQWTDNIPKVFECIIMGVYTCKKKKKSPRADLPTGSSREWWHKERLSLYTLIFGVTDLAIPYLGGGDPEEITDVPRHKLSQHSITDHHLAPIGLIFHLFVHSLIQCVVTTSSVPGHGNRLFISQDLSFDTGCPILC